jgi:hypothetical protein
MVPRLGRLMVAVGFLWMCLWAIVGSLLGAKINSSLFTQDQIWLQSVQRELLRTAHAHMNTMSYAIILMGVTLRHALAYQSNKFCNSVAITALISVPIFGAGLVLESFFPTERGSFSPVVLLSGIGGSGCLFSFGAWGMIFLWGFVREK